MKTALTTLIENNTKIETDNLLIYPIHVNLKLFSDLFEIYSSSSNVFNYCNQHFDLISSSKVWKHKLETMQNHYHESINYIIELKSESKIIGRRNVILDAIFSDEGDKILRFSPHNNVISEIIINENYWGRGFAFEASEAIFKLLKENGIENILTFVPKNNIKSANLDKKLGFTESTFAEAILYYGYFPNCAAKTHNIHLQKVFLKELT